MVFISVNISLFQCINSGFQGDRGDAAFHAAGAIQTLSVGTFALLPLAHKVIERLTRIIDHEFQAIEGQKVELNRFPLTELAIE